MYIYVDSTACLDYFSDNTATAFRVKLAKPLILLGAWEVALTAIDIPNFSSAYDTAYVDINSNICEESICNSSLQPMLCRVSKKEIARGKEIRFPRPSYVRLNSEEISVLQVYMTDAGNGKPSFRSGHSYCTLHIRQCSKRDRL